MEYEKPSFYFFPLAKVKESKISLMVKPMATIHNPTSLPQPLVKQAKLSKSQKKTTQSQDEHAFFYPNYKIENFSIVVDSGLPVKTSDSVIEFTMKSPAILKKKQKFCIVLLAHCDSEGKTILKCKSGMALLKKNKQAENCSITISESLVSKEKSQKNICFFNLPRKLETETDLGFLNRPIDQIKEKIQTKYNKKSKLIREDITSYKMCSTIFINQNDEYKNRLISFSSSASNASKAICQILVAYYNTIKQKIEGHSGGTGTVVKKEKDFYILTCLHVFSSDLSIENIVFLNFTGEDRFDSFVSDSSINRK